MKLVDRDYMVLRELDRWRFLLGRQIWLLCGFSSKRTCDRRLKTLKEAGYIEQEYKLYGVPRFNTVSRSGKSLIGASLKPDKVRLEQIYHDIAVVDTAIYFHLKEGVPLGSISSEKSLHRLDGFDTPRRHQPDFVFKQEQKIHAIEVELNAKAKNRMMKILSDNYTAYETQKWVVPNDGSKIRRILKEKESSYPNIEVLSLEEITEYVKHVGGGSGG